MVMLPFNLTTLFLLAKHTLDKVVNKYSVNILSLVTDIFEPRFLNDHIENI